MLVTWIYKYIQKLIEEVHLKIYLLNELVTHVNKNSTHCVRNRK